MCQLMGSMLMLWNNRQQNSVTLSIAEVECIIAGSCCIQLLLMKQQLVDYEFAFKSIPVRSNNTSAMNLTKNLLEHLRTKHKLIRHHFTRDHVNSCDVTLEFVPPSV